MVEIGLLHLQPFINSFFHFSIIASKWLTLVSVVPYYPYTYRVLPLIEEWNAWLTKKLQARGLYLLYILLIHGFKNLWNIFMGIFNNLFPVIQTFAFAFKSGNCSPLVYMYVYSRGGPQPAPALRPSLIYCAFVHLFIKI
jgi:hypothetical protein